MGDVAGRSLLLRAAVRLLTERGAAAAPRCGRRPFSQLRSPAWLGQTAASLCWLTSMLVYGLDSPGDWLQLGAASAWLLANLAALRSADTDTDAHKGKVAEGEGFEPSTESPPNPLSRRAH